MSLPPHSSLSSSLSSKLEIYLRNSPKILFCPLLGCVSTVSNGLITVWDALSGLLLVESTLIQQQTPLTTSTNSRKSSLSERDSCTTDSLGVSTGGGGGGGGGGREWCGSMGSVVGRRVWAVGESCVVDYSLFTAVNNSERKKRKKKKTGLMVEYFLSDVKFILAAKHYTAGRRGSPVCSLFASISYDNEKDNNINNNKNNNNNNNNNNNPHCNIITFELPRQDTSSLFFLALSTHRVLVFSTTHFRTLFEIQVDSIPVSLHIFNKKVWILTQNSKLVSFCLSNFVIKSYKGFKGVVLGGEEGEREGRDDFICGSEVVDGRLWVGLCFYYFIYLHFIFFFLFLFFFFFLILIILMCLFLALSSPFPFFSATGNGTIVVTEWKNNNDDNIEQNECPVSKITEFKTNFGSPSFILSSPFLDSVFIGSRV